MNKDQELLEQIRDLLEKCYTSCLAFQIGSMILDKELRDLKNENI